MSVRICAESLVLARAVTDAVARVGRAKAAYDQDARDKRDATMNANELSAARKREQLAATALSEHKLAHGC